MKVVRYALFTSLAACATLAHASQGTVETGKAAYYSAAYAGQKTASSERYNPGELVTAHKRHPFGTRLRVTNLKNDKSVIVRVVDRGPFTSGRVVDVSQRAAQQLGFLRDGIAHVKVEVVD